MVTLTKMKTSLGHDVSWRPMPRVFIVFLREAGNEEMTLTETIPLVSFSSIYGSPVALGDSLLRTTSIWLRICFISPVGFKGNLSLLDILSHYFQGTYSQMEDQQADFTFHDLSEDGQGVPMFGL